jgi:hypothetical protein
MLLVRGFRRPLGEETLYFRLARGGCVRVAPDGGGDDGDGKGSADLARVERARPPPPPPRPRPDLGDGVGEPGLLLPLLLLLLLLLLLVVLLGDDTAGDVALSVSSRVGTVTGCGAVGSASLGLAVVPPLAWSLSLAKNCRALGGGNGAALEPVTVLWILPLLVRRDEGVGDVERAFLAATAAAAIASPLSARLSLSIPRLCDTVDDAAWPTLAAADGAVELEPEAAEAACISLDGTGVGNRPAKRRFGMVMAALGPSFMPPVPLAPVMLLPRDSVDDESKRAATEDRAAGAVGNEGSGALAAWAASFSNTLAAL